jgi:hypothetical protein
MTEMATRVARKLNLSFGSLCFSRRMLRNLAMFREAPTNGTQGMQPENCFQTRARPRSTSAQWQHNGNWQRRGLIDMIYAPFSRSAQRERVLKVLELSQCSKRRQNFEDGRWVLRTYRGPRRRLSRTLRERLPKKKEIDAQNDNRVQTLCSLTVMGCNSVYECRWRRDGP